MRIVLVSELKERALQRYASVKGTDPEQLVSGSDDFTLFLWRPGESKKAVARMTGEEDGSSPSGCATNLLNSSHKLCWQLLRGWPLFEVKMYRKGLKQCPL